SRTSFGRIANTLAGSTPGLIVPIARIFVVGVDVVMSCAYPEFGPKRLKISIRPPERACFIYLFHNVRRLVAQSLLFQQTVASSQASTDPKVLLSASQSTEPDGLEALYADFESIAWWWPSNACNQAPTYPRVDCNLHGKEAHLIHKGSLPENTLRGQPGFQ